VRHGTAIHSGGSGGALPALRSLQKSLARLHEDLATTCEANLYSLQYLASVGQGQQHQPQAPQLTGGSGSDGVASGGGAEVEESSADDEDSNEEEAGSGGAVDSQASSEEEEESSGEEEEATSSEAED
jgi:cobalamin biosynthesis protein CobT